MNRSTSAKAMLRSCFLLFYFVTTVRGLFCNTGIENAKFPLECPGVTHCLAFFKTNNSRFNIYICDIGNMHCGSSGNNCSSGEGGVKKCCCDKNLCNTKFLNGEQTSINDGNLTCYSDFGKNAKPITCAAKVTRCLRYSLFDILNYACDDHDICLQREGEYEIKFGVVKAKALCCKGDLCNTKVEDDFEPETPENITCYTGNGNRPTEMTTCDGNSSFCTILHNDNSTITYSCDNENTCTEDKKNITDGNSTIYCCKGNLCNSKFPEEIDFETPENFTCYSGNSPTEKTVCDTNTTYCKIFYNGDKNSVSYSCDDNNFCQDNSTISTNGKNKTYCCAGNLCNSKQPKEIKIIYPGLTCYGVSCVETSCHNAGYCVVISSNGNRPIRACDEENQLCSAVGNTVNYSTMEEIYCCDSHLCNFGMPFVFQTSLMILFAGFIL